MRRGEKEIYEVRQKYLTLFRPFIKHTTFFNKHVNVTRKENYLQDVCTLLCR